MEKRFLSVAVDGIEYRAAAAGESDEKPIAAMIVGYAAKFNVRSQPLGGFVEMIAPGAFDECLTGDTVALFNHDANLVLGRSTAGSLKLSVDDVGLRYECVLAGDEVSERVAAYIADGRISQSSFGFNIAMDGDRWDRLDDGVVLRTINRVERLYDVSPVTYPAYTQSEVMLRSAFEAVVAAETAAAADARHRRANARRRELELTQPR